MRYELYQDEYAAVPTMTDAQLMEYFLLRVFETEEVWGLKEGELWLTRKIDGQITQPVWPYKRYAADAAVDAWKNLSPAADSLEFFLYQRLGRLATQGVMMEIMPRNPGHGCLVDPQHLFSILEGMIDSGTYSMDG